MGRSLSADQWATIEPAGTGRPRRTLRRLDGRHWSGPVEVTARWGEEATPDAVVTATVLIFTAAWRLESQSTRSGTVNESAALPVTEVMRGLKPYMLVGV